MKGLTPGNSCSSTSPGVSPNALGRAREALDKIYPRIPRRTLHQSHSRIYRRGTREKFMKPIADDVIVNAYYIHFDYFLSCIPISGKVLKLEGSFVTRKVYTVYSYNITRFVPTDACHQDCIRNNNIRVPGEMCE